MIKILDTLTANSIAAGEVVERPAAVVKELVENSIDAGATTITIAIKNGGIQLIRVVDNGCGMRPDDAKICFLRHATSKIQEISDLNNLRTMGFRGEALASIAAVSKTTLITRQIGTDTAFKLVIEGTDIIESGEVGSAEGTVVEVKKLFFNTPARYKFLKRDSTEAGYVEEVVTHLALAHPHIAFQLIKDGTEVLRTPGNGELKSTIYALLGREVADNLLPLQYSIGEVSVSGYLAAPNVSRNNRRSYYILVNQRSVQASIAQVAIEEACRTRFMKKRFPVVILSLQVPTNFVDVNIHPQKLQVKFKDENIVFRAIYHAVKDALEMGGRIMPSADISIPQNYEISKVNKEQQSALKKPAGSSPTIAEQLPVAEQTAKTFQQEEQLNFLQDLPQKISYATPRASLVKFSEPASEKVQAVADSKSVFSEERRKAPLLETEENLESECKANSPSLEVEYRDSVKSVDIGELADVEILGQVFNTYILVKNSRYFMLIDQHAAHERILYEQFSSRRFNNPEKIYRRELLKAENIKVTLSEMSALEKYREQFLALGFEYEIFGEKDIVLRAVPDLPAKRFEKDTFRDMIHLAEKDLLDKVDLIDELYHTMACKAAIKANDPLSREEIEALIRDLQKLKNPYQCPHGRPTIIYLSRQDMDKLFKRIV